MLLHTASSQELSPRDTHRIPILHHNHLLADSRGLGWRHAYASLTAEQSWSAALSPLPHDCLVYCLNGQADIAREVEHIGPAAEACLKPRGISLIPAGMPSHWVVNGTPDIFLLYLHADLKRRAVVDCGLGGDEEVLLAPLLAQSDALLEQICLTLLNNLRSSAPSVPHYVDQLAQTAMMHLVFNYRANMFQQASEMNSALPAVACANGVARALAYIEACTSEDLSVGMLADVAGLSKTCFARAFVKQVGGTPHQYVLKTRVNKAKALLQECSTPLAEIALELGFANQSHFTAAFRRLTGITPSQYRRGV